MQRGRSKFSGNAISGIVHGKTEVALGDKPQCSQRQGQLPCRCSI